MGCIERIKGGTCLTNAKKANVAGNSYLIGMVIQIYQMEPGIAPISIVANVILVWTTNQKGLSSTIHGRNTDATYSNGDKGTTV